MFMWLQISELETDYQQRLLIIKVTYGIFQEEMSIFLKVRVTIIVIEKVYIYMCVCVCVCVEF